MNTKTVWGSVRADGTILSGDDFTVTAKGKGEYVISFSSAFSGLPAVVASQILWGTTQQDPRDNVVFPFVTKDAVTAITADCGGNHCNRAFSFIAIGAK
jgi:hypothetical protein